MIYIVEMKAPESGEWVVAPGATANTEKSYALEEMKPMQAANPGVEFRAWPYVPMRVLTAGPKEEGQ